MKAKICLNYPSLPYLLISNVVVLSLVQQKYLLASILLAFYLSNVDCLPAAGLLTFADARVPSSVARRQDQAAQVCPDGVDVRQRLAVYHAEPAVGAGDHRWVPDVPRCPPMSPPLRPPAPCCPVRGIGSGSSRPVCRVDPDSRPLRGAAADSGTLPA